MTAAATLVDLGERYAALGLQAAARAAWARALRAGAGAAAASRLIELALASGDTAGALGCARALIEQDPGPGSRVLLGRAQLAAGELAAARRAFAAAVEAAGAPPLVRARAHEGRARVALAEGDAAGAGANVMAALDELLAWIGAADRAGEALDRELGFAEELLGQAAALDRAGDAAASIDELARARPEGPWRLLQALLAAARQVHGDRVSDADIEALLEAEAERRPSRAVRLSWIERKLRRRHRDAAARAEAIAALEALADELGGARATVADNLDLARAWLLLAAAFEDDPGTAGRAEAAYRRGLALRPGHAAAAERLADLALARGDHDTALAEIARALRIDAGHGPVWRTAARLLEASSPGAPLSGALEQVLDAAAPGAGRAARAAVPQLFSAAVEVARSDVLAGMHARGHRMKNLLGIVGARARSARKMAGEGKLAERLRGLEGEITGLYEEWGAYLRSMQTAGPVVEVVAVAPLLAEVLEAASARTQVRISPTVPAGLPELRGDRVMLREALLNIVSNAAEACAAGEGAVEIDVRQVASGGAPVVEIVVEDSGPGIPRSDLARVFAPGFTTKDAGSGLGLAIAERVVAAHHGRLALDSEPGRGTRVTVGLPTDLGGFAGLAAFASGRGGGEAA